ncbi:MAG: SpoIIE family protein phosphatase [Salinivirgaceae bacterium]|nr:SpoIIE family protein phosphatase [Salinivirgaceae bacterium]
MKKISILLMFAFLLGLTVNAQTKNQFINQYGLPFITTYSNKVYGGHAQNNGIVQDKRGFLYFANQEGVLEYDGARWNLIRKTYIQSLSVDTNNIVHVGIYDGTFGYLKPNEVGELEYVSLSDKLDSITFDSPIYNTYSYNDKTYYCSTNYIVEAVGDSITYVAKMPDGSFLSYGKGDSILIGRENRDFKMQVYHNHKFTDLVSEVSGGVFGVAEYDGDKYLAVSYRKDGLIVFGTVSSYLNRNEHVFYERLLSDSCTTPYNLVRAGDYYALSSVQAETYTLTMFDKNFDPLFVLNKSMGFPSFNAVASLNASDMLWTATTDGIAKTEWASAIRIFKCENTGLGTVQDMIEYNGILFLATSEGLFERHFMWDDMASFLKVIPFSVNTTIEYKVPKSNRKLLLAGTAYDLRIVGIDDVVEEKISGLQDLEYVRILQLNKHPEQLMACLGGGKGVQILEYRPRGAWEEIARFEEMQGTSICEDANSNIWIGTWSGSVYRMTDGDTQHFTQYDDNDGLPAVGMITVGIVNGKALFFTECGVYEFNEGTSRFELSYELGSISSDTTHAISRINPFRGGYAIANLNDEKGENWVSVVYKNADGEYEVSDDAARALKKIPNESFYSMYVDSDTNLWFSTNDVLYCYNPNFIGTDEPYYRKSFDSHIRKVVANDSITIFGGAFTSPDGKSIIKKQIRDNEHKVVIPYKNNSLTFAYSATFFDEENKTEYSTMLEGDDKTWSKWKTSTEYSRRGLSEGKYVFKVKARNIYGVESPVAEYAFIIRPPFYRSIVAYIFYIALLVALVYGIVKWNTRRLIEEKKKLEQKIAEATEEIRGQNVQLEQQKDEIEKQKDEIQSSINYARRIQRALLTPDEIIDKIFPDHFLLYKPRNVVSGDYYWFGQFGDYKVSIVADCTGHGVPGGFMSMLGMTNLNYIVGQELRPDEILNKLRNAIITSLRQKDDTPAPTGDEKADRRAAFAASVEKKDRSQDGMDVAMYVLNEKEMTLSFAGANNPLVLIRDGEVEVVKASKMPVGIYAKLDPFERVDMEIKKGDCLYTFSDGFQDQFGYESGKKFMSKHLREVLLEIHQKPMAEQKEILNKIYEDWRGPADHQTDDVVLMGVRI